MGLTQSMEAWQKYLTNYDEGLGVVYERFMLNDCLDALVTRYRPHTVLEAPLYGMAGVSGINSVPLARRGCTVTLVDSNLERLTGVQRIWDELGLAATFVHHEDMAHLPFPAESFDLAWEWAALWYVPDWEAVLRELARVSRRLVFVAMTNTRQIGYLLRKYLIDKDFFIGKDERCADMGRIKHILRAHGVRIVQEGVLDVPPWPDTVMPAAQVLERLGLRSRKLQGRFQGDDWHWSTMDYYLGRRPELKAQIERYAFLDRAPLPWQLKALWAHHRYVLGEKSTLQE